MRRTTPSERRSLIRVLPDNRTDPVADRLDSWKDIAAYLRRDVSTVQRWEKREGLPVHRHLHDKQGSVYAYKSELDGWWQQGRKELESDIGDATRGGRKGRRRWFLASIAVVIAAIVGTVGWRLEFRTASPGAAVVVRSAIPLPPGAASLDALAVSPDGSHVVYVGWTDPLAGWRLYLKPMNEIDSVPLPGTERGRRPFFSPDGQWIAFFVEQKLKKIAITGGAPVTICDAPPLGGTWARDDTIVFVAGSLKGLSRVSANGGQPEAITTPDRSRFERAHRDPHFLPDGRTVLFTTHRADHDSFDDADIEAVNIETRRRSVVVSGGMNGSYTQSGHLVYGRHGALFAAIFDTGRLRVTTPPVKVIEGVRADSTSGRVQYGISEDGTLVYSRGTAITAPRHLVWVDRAGNAERLAVPVKPYLYPRISPDNQHVVVETDDGSPKLWLYDLARGTLTRRMITWDAEEPVWAPDGRRLAFGRGAFMPDGTSQLGIYEQPLDGSSEPTALTPTLPNYWVYDWSPDGRYFAFGQVARSTHFDLWLLALDSERGPRPLLATPANERAARFSPDNRWLAYVSDESGRDEVYVRSFPAFAEMKQISVGGGTQPVWARDGSELYYRAEGNRMMAVQVTGGDELTISKPAALFTGPYYWPVGVLPQYDVSADARFLMITTPPEAKDPEELMLVQNWFEELNQKVPAR